MNYLNYWDTTSNEIEKAGRSIYDLEEDLIYNPLLREDITSVHDASDNESDKGEEEMLLQQISNLKKQFSMETQEQALMSLVEEMPEEKPEPIPEPLPEEEPEPDIDLNDIIQKDNETKKVDERL